MKQYFWFFGIIGIILFSCEKIDVNNNGNDDNDTEISLDSLVTITSNLPVAIYVDLMFISENIGYALSTSFVAKTTDGGYSWTTFAIPEYTNGGKIQFVNEQIGYVTVGTQNSGMLLKTTNGGQDWEEIDLNTYESPMGIYFLDKNIGFIVGKGLFIKTTDGGKSWTNLKKEDTFMYLGVNFKNDKEGIVTSFNGEYFKTIDGGITWDKLKIDAFHLYDVYFVGNKALASAYHQDLFDLTKNEKVVSLPSSGLKFAFFNSDCGVATGTLITGSWSHTNNVFLTSNGWKTFTQKTLAATEGNGPICAKMSDKKVMVLTDRRVMVLEK